MKPLEEKRFHFDKKKTKEKERLNILPHDSHGLLSFCGFVMRH